MSFSAGEIKQLTEQIKEAGTVVVNAKEGAGSATLSMAYAGARLVLRLVNALQGKAGIVECAYVDVRGTGTDLETDYFALPVEVGREGIVKIHPLPQLSEFEQAQLKEAVPVLKKNIETGSQFVANAH